MNKKEGWINISPSFLVFFSIIPRFVKRKFWILDVGELNYFFMDFELFIFLDELVNVEKVDFFLEQLKLKGKDLGLKPKETFCSLRYILSGSFQGLSMHDLLDILDWDVIRRRIENI